MAKIAISLPDDVLQDVESERQVTGESRSAFFRRAVESFLRHRREREAIRQYVRGYQRHPEPEREHAWAESTLHEVLSEVPWEDDTQQSDAVKPFALDLKYGTRHTITR